MMVTGGAGFIGSNLVDRLLAEGYSVDVVDNLSSGKLSNLGEARSLGKGKFSFFQLDVVDYELEELIQLRRPEVIYHLAAQISVRSSMVDPLTDAQINVLGSLRVLEAARKASVSKVVYAASGGTLYGECGSRDSPATEGNPRELASPYGVSKAAVLDYLKIYRDAYDLEYTALALGNVYGVRQDPHGEAGVVAIFSEAMVKGEECKLYGDGLQSRDFVYVDDVVDAFVRAGESGGGMVLNVGTGRGTTVLEVFEELSFQCGYGRQPEYLPQRLGELNHSVLNPSLVKLHLGWEAWTTIRVGLTNTLQWMGKEAAN